MNAIELTFSVFRVRPMNIQIPNRIRFRLTGVASILAALTATTGFCGESSDPLLDLLIKKGFISEQEAGKVKAEADAARAANTATNAMPPIADSKWKISNAIKSVELFGDIRLRYEEREADLPGGGGVKLDRGRYAVRLGLRGEAFDNFYYGLRLDTANNPRSPWVTFGTSSSGVPYQGPFGKSTAGVEIGQAYLGWRPTSWLDLTVGKMPNPLFTTPMVWDWDLNPEGAAERFKTTVGNADLFATFGQFLYADLNPNNASGGLGIGVNSAQGQSTDNAFLLAWQGGANYHFTTNVSAKFAATLYNYIGLTPNVPPFYGNDFVGEGAYLGPGTGTVNGSSGYNPGAGATTPGFFAGFPNNQTGLKHLLVLELPLEVNFKISKLDARVFGDFAYNFDGRQRAEAAAAGYANYISINSGTLTPFTPQRNDVKAYQIGFAIGSHGTLGLVNNAASGKHAWEFRTYWQHLEQYALDPNIIDSDFFEGRANLEGFYTSVAYGLSANVTATVRYGWANRINSKLGTGGINQDIPQVNPIDHYNLLQLDLGMRF
jgi:hypothetical protein